MEFKLKVVSFHPSEGELVLNAEVPLSGVKFIEAFGATLRRSIDHVGRYKHTTLGGLAMYEMIVPQQMAIESGHFTTNDTYTVYVEKNLLSNYIFYQASLNLGSTGRPCYPYMTNEATLVSQIDELAFLADWASTGYARYLKMCNGQLVDATISTMSTGTSSGSTDTGNTDSDSGCDGCPVDPSCPNPPPQCWPPCPPPPCPCPPPPKPPCPCPCPPPKHPVIGNNSEEQDIPDEGDIRVEPFEGFDDIYDPKLLTDLMM